MYIANIDLRVQCVVPPHPAHGANGSLAIVFGDDLGRGAPTPDAAGRHRTLAHGLRSGLAVARCRGGGGVVPGRRALARRAGLYLEHPDHGRPAGDRGDAAPDAGPHQACEFPYPVETHAAAPGHAAPTNLMESGTNGAAT